jgi:nucleotide-binding universal stress UspA family protein
VEVFQRQTLRPRGTLLKLLSPLIEAALSQAIAHRLKGSKKLLEAEVLHESTVDAPFHPASGKRCSPKSALLTPNGSFGEAPDSNRWHHLYARRNVQRGGISRKEHLSYQDPPGDTDGSEEAELASQAAAELVDKTGSELHVVHVFGIIPWYPVYPEGTDFDETELEDPQVEEDLQRTSKQQARELLDAEVERIRSVGGTVAQAHLREGGAVQEMVGLAEEIGVGLIVVGSRGRGGIRRALMESVSDSVVKHAHCPVLVVRTDNGRA